jgi:hypothetical protein
MAFRCVKVNRNEKPTSQDLERRIDKVESGSG